MSEPGSLFKDRYNMKVIQTVEEFRGELEHIDRPLGLVPTMGFLHAGHLAVVRQARVDSSTLAASIFVNPAQFGPQEDYSVYPRDMEGDLRKLDISGVDLVLMPSVKEMYPEGFDTHVCVGKASSKLEGAARPGHFRGVATVVAKLLSISRPEKAYFGQKDAQQALVVKRINADLNLGAEIVVVPTSRDVDGLAFSSRNAYLSSDERKAATVLFRSLQLARDMWNCGNTDAKRIVDEMRALIDREPLARVDYISVTDTDALEEVVQVDRTSMVLLAVYIGKIRLIDNISIGADE